MTSRTVDNDPFSPLYRKIAGLEKLVNNMRNGKNVNLPIRSADNLPAQAAEGDVAIGDDGTLYGYIDDVWVALGGGSSTNPFQMLVGMNVPGVLAPISGTQPWDAPYDCTIDFISGSVRVAPTGSSLTFRVKVNGSSIGTGTISASGTYTTYVPSPVSINAGDRLFFDILTVGSTNSGNDLAILINGTWS